ncbi:hypothetical protein EIKCOROL_00780 [Eikenella corrodens ATCC 23834]|uniref:Uncharacterized protein n=1 Tax=Eikenella corrodens ATCC 23834 TaxID=546274 RepID=C0DTV0_EIKCO|nr:hypothetical protein EIKCOROL_00780 [Eikenella corrodens ATCC 23834]
MQPDTATPLSGSPTCCSSASPKGYLKTKQSGVSAKLKQCFGAAEAEPTKLIGKTKAVPS